MVRHFVEEKGINVNVKDKNGKTPLDMAEERRYQRECYPEIAYYLRQKGTH